MKGAGRDRVRRGARVGERGLREHWVKRSTGGEDVGEESTGGAAAKARAGLGEGAL
jgi:hypothetical protein